MTLHRLLSLEDVGDPERLKTGPSSALHPVSPEVEAEYLLTDQFADVFREIEDAARRDTDWGIKVNPFAACCSAWLQPWGRALKHRHAGRAIAEVPMNTMQTPSSSLDELATLAVRFGRELERTAHAIFLGGNNQEFGFTSRTLHRLAEREPFGSRDEASLDALRGITKADVRSEVRGSERRFFETHYDDAGQQDEVRNCSV